MIEKELATIVVVVALLFLFYYLINEKVSTLSSDIKALSGILSTDIELFDNNINKTNSRIDSLETRLNELTYRISKLESRKKGLVEPSLEELMNFIQEDDTDKHEYIEENNRFVCVDYANMFISNFAKKGYYSCLTAIYFDDKAHALVAVNTTDYGIVYVEPQDDKIIYELSVGENYCEKVNWDCNWIIKNIKDCYRIGG